MKQIIVATLVLFSIVSIAQAQQPPDPAFLQRALTALQAQRNQAMDAVAVSEARATGLAEELAKAQARIKELEAAKAKQEEKK